MTKISVCMIVKNEEAVLARCLDSLRDLPDEIIIVDTGSTDGTKKVAQKYTDKLYDFEWVDDFAAARNFSLSKAGCDYIYVADADEVLDGENYHRFKQLKEVLLAEVEVVEMGYANLHSFATTENFELEYRPKLFRRIRASQYADPIHEALRTDPVVYRSNVVVGHCPLAGHAGRDLAHFARLVEKGVRFSSRLEIMYARELLAGGALADFRTAAPYFKAVQEDLSRPAETLRRAVCVLAQHAALERDPRALLMMAAPELVGTPPSEVCCSLGDYFLACDFVQQAADWYAAALSGAVPELIASSAGSWPLKGLAACYEAGGDTVKAKEYLDQANSWTAESLKN